jgi:hypothetical protein
VAEHDDSSSEGVSADDHLDAAQTSELNRRKFLGRTGKALYSAPVLTVLGSLSMRAAAQFGPPPCPPNTVCS